MGRNSRVLILIAGIIMIPAILFAQLNNRTSSPYSRYGLGDLQSYSLGRTAAMGGAALASRYALQINNANPASYTATDSLNFLFEFGLKGDFARYSSEISKMKTSDIDFNYFSMSFRINRWMATSIGLTPYSDVGYQVEVNEDIENTGAARTMYYGTGTISDAYWGLAIQPFKNLSVGMNLNYRFGKVSRNSELTFEYSDIYMLQRKSQLRITDFGLKFGAQFILPMKNEKQLVLAGVFENKPTYTAFESDIVLKNIYYAQQARQDTISGSNVEQKGKIVFPTTIGFGASYSKKNVYELNFDFYHQGWANATIMGEKSQFLSDLNKFALGVEWIPEKFSIRHAWKRVAYRAGIKYEQTYHTLNGHQINDFGISFGLGLPIYRSNSTINISAEFGKRGTTKYDLVRENYAKVNLSANLHDLWFMSRKID